MKKISLLLTLTLLFYGCEQSQPEVAVKDSSKLTIESIKKTLQKSRLAAVASNDFVLWDNYKESKDTEGKKIIVVPYLSNTIAGLSIYSKNEKKEDTRTANLKSFLLFKEIGDSISVSKAIVSKNEKEYAQRKSKELKRETFDGYIQIYDADNVLLEFSKFSNGKLKYRYAKTNASKRGKIRDADITQYEIETCITYYYQVCGGGYCSAWKEGETFCHYMYYYETGGSSLGASQGSLDAILGSGADSISDLTVFSSLPGFWDWYNTLNLIEREYFGRNFNLIPRAIAARISAYNYTKMYYCKEWGQGDNGNWNAFQHAMWSGMNALLMGHREALIIALNHEEGASKDTPLQVAQYNMDSYNNFMGVSIFHDNMLTVVLDPGKLATLILNKVANGQLKRIVDIYNPSLMPTNGDNRCNLNEE